MVWLCASVVERLLDEYESKEFIYERLNLNILEMTPSGVLDSSKL